MIINLSDPEISKTYQLVLKAESKDWLILAYSKARDALRLVDSGLGGPDALRSHMGSYSSDVTFALVQAGGVNSLVLLCYIPPTVGGVKRARAIVHCRAVEEIFPARRAVLNIASETEVNATQLGHALRPAPRKSLPNSAPSSILAMGLHRPMSPPQSLEERRSSNPLPPLPSSTHTPPREHGLLLNLPEPLDDERRRELHDQQAAASKMLAPIKNNPPARALSPKGVKPQLSVSVPPRGEKGLRPIPYDGVAGTYEFDDEDDNDNDVRDDDEEEEEDEQEQEQDEDEEAPGQGSYLSRQHSRPSSRGPTPPPGPSILRHPSPIPPRPDLMGLAASAPNISAHIRFTGPPKDHPHPDHHPLKPTDQIVPPPPRSALPHASEVPKNQGNASGTSFGPTPLSKSEVPSQASTTTPESSSLHPAHLGPSSRADPPRSTPPHHSAQPSDVAQHLSHQAVTWQPTSQPGPATTLTSAFNNPHPSQDQPSNLPAGQMSPPNLGSSSGASGPPAHRPLPPQPSASSATPSALSFNPSLLSTHSRNASVSTAPGQTHVPSGTLCAFGRRPSVSSTQPGATNANTAAAPTSPAPLNHSNSNATLDRPSSVTLPSSSAFRPMPMQTQGMTEAQAQAARSRAKWAAQEQGLTLPAPSAAVTAMPRSPPLTPPTSPPRSLSVDEAGRVRRDGVEKMRREAERRREEDEKKRVAEERRLAEAEQQLKLDKEREEREAKELVEREEKRKHNELQRKALEEDLSKRRAEERVSVREKFAEVKGTNEVFLTGHVNIQAENTMTWRRRFYELTAGGRLSLYKSPDAPDRIKALDTIDIKGAKTINRSADELELIPHAFKVEFGGKQESWSFYTDSQHDMDILTESMTWTMGSPAA
ncbi:hypothetical protein BDV93DRAFT_604839 [Ceratobasidium sp. AG-I]|nr:hypothetical protein BDV93DRAFT_604839 [Ceratobasidium sp. AG-I]